MKTFGCHLCFLKILRVFLDLYFGFRLFWYCLFFLKTTKKIIRTQSKKTDRQHTDIHAVNSWTSSHRKQTQVDQCVTHTRPHLCNPTKKVSTRQRFSPVVEDEIHNEDPQISTVVSKTAYAYNIWRLYYRTIHSIAIKPHLRNPQRCTTLCGPQQKGAVSRFKVFGTYLKSSAMVKWWSESFEAYIHSNQDTSVTTKNIKWKKNYRGFHWKETLRKSLITMSKRCQYWMMKNF